MRWSMSLSGQVLMIVSFICVRWSWAGWSSVCGRHVISLIETRLHFLNVPHFYFLSFSLCFFFFLPFFLSFFLSSFLLFFFSFSLANFLNVISFYSYIFRSLVPLISSLANYFFPLLWVEMGSNSIKHGRKDCHSKPRSGERYPWGYAVYRDHKQSYCWDSA